MQALSLQIVNPQQERDVSVKKIPTAKSEAKEPSFKEMVESASKKDLADNSPSKEKVQKVSNASDEPDANSVEEKPSTEVQNSSSAVFASFAVVQEPSVQAESSVNLDFQNELSSDSEILPSSEQLAFLRSEDFSLENKTDDFSAENNFFLSLKEMQNLQAAQNLSVDEPGKFLENIKPAGHFSSSDEKLSLVSLQSSPDETAVLQNSAELSQLGISLESGEKKPDFFNLELSSSDGKGAKEVPSLFENIFTVTDERSVEQKIADFKSEMKSDYSEQDNSLNLSLSLSETAKQNILSSNNQTAGASGSTFQQMLSQQIQFNAPDFVRAGNIVLQDNNSGSINMILKPENLGNVKINLHLSDNVITGQITVNSKEAFDAFKQNLETLKQAFQNSGFENANLSLSYADASSGSFAQGERQQSSEQFFSNKVYGDYASSAEISGAASSQAAYSADSDRKISVVA
ncbi:MAG: flagellar hook-length control protein FliK [Treponema succinifaciens]|uniref:flagellar hook-length control protein FliK n=1 Tax=Treponema TaxID=157 RepID=UPI0023F523F0|nr:MULTISPECIES: flagellar hook-length control protein FliK [Treponema]MDD6962932.1 flagellar hook-length control protein FliK [Treponema succinifaciens]MDY5117567.1 flagellar hook-length control protein FliK [Treponema succinifaciens]